MIKVSEVQTLFGGAFLGIIVTKAPAAFGYGQMPSTRAEVIGSLVGVIAAVFAVISQRKADRKRITAGTTASADRPE
jgi:hypothetical protein